MFRLYSPTEPLFDGAWSRPDVERTTDWTKRLQPSVEPAGGSPGRPPPSTAVALRRGATSQRFAPCSYNWKLTRFG